MNHAKLIELLANELDLYDSEESYYSFDKIIALWLEYQKNTFALNTYVNTKLVVDKHIVPYFKELNIPLKDLNPSHFEKYYQIKMDEGLSANSMKHHHAYIGSTLRWAWKNDWICSNIADKISPVKVEKYQAHPLTLEQAEKYLSIFKNDKIELPVMIALFLGLRRSEVLGLKWTDFSKNKDVKTVTVQRRVVRVPSNGILIKNGLKNGTKQRTLSVPEILVDLFINKREQQLNNYKKNGHKKYYNRDYLGFIFVDEYGNLLNPDYISKRFKKVQRENCLDPVRFHDLRHSCATLLYAFGHHDKDVQIWLGHSSIQTTMDIYTHEVTARNETLANSFDNYFIVSHDDRL